MKKFMCKPDVSNNEKIERFYRLVLHLLDDDGGISEDAYNSLLDILNSEFEEMPKKIDDVICRVKATNARFYIDK